MPNTDPCNPRPHLLSQNSLVDVLKELKPAANSTHDMWRLLTERFVVDLDAVAKVLPAEEPETVWLSARA
ncbi:hypothetical protein FMGBMHLM_2824 [Methylobacterium aerolatum]|nr:hypothetical protein FMGBMHLM_2824 [Methylobacterium aerolatum]